MLTLTFAGDESGDVSFSFDKGASRYFVVAVIATDDPDGLRNQLSDLRKRAGLPVDFEFKFHKLTSKSLRQRTFQTLAQSSFESWAIIVEKTALPDAFKLMNSLDFYLYFITELLRIIPHEKSNGATLILDEFGSPRKLRSEMRRVLKLRSITPNFKHIIIRHSHSESLIQIADLVAGAILHRDARTGSIAFEYVEKKLNRLLEFRS